MAAAPLPQPPAGASAPPQGGAPPQGAQPQGAPGAGAGQGNLKQTIEEFRQVAMQLQMLATKYPESSDTIQQILPLLQKAMASVAGNPDRSSPPQAPPVGA